MPNMSSFLKGIRRLSNQGVRRPAGDDATSEPSCSISSTLLSTLSSGSSNLSDQDAKQGNLLPIAALSLQSDQKPEPLAINSTTTNLATTLPRVDLPAQNASRHEAPAVDGRAADLEDQALERAEAESVESSEADDRCPSKYRLRPEEELGCFFIPLADAKVNAGPREKLESMKEEWRRCPNMISKVDAMVEMGYRGWRRIRGDGSCYYRSVGFGLLELLVEADDDIRISRISLLCEQLRSVTFLAKGDAERSDHEELIDRIAQLGKGNSKDKRSSNPHEARNSQLVRELSQLLHNFKRVDCTLDAALIRALRNLSAKYLRENINNTKDWAGLTPQILMGCEGWSDMEAYLEKEVLTPGAEAHQLAIELLPRSLDIKVRIVFMSERDAGESLFQTAGVHNNEDVDQPDDIMVHITLRPGHYDLLYYKPCRHPANDDDTRSAGQMLQSEAPRAGLVEANAASWQRTIPQERSINLTGAPLSEQVAVSSIHDNDSEFGMEANLTADFGCRRNPTLHVSARPHNMTLPASWRHQMYSVASRQYNTPQTLRPPSFGDQDEYVFTCQSAHEQEVVNESEPADYEGMIPRTQSEERRQIDQAIQQSVADRGQSDARPDFWGFPFSRDLNSGWNDFVRGLEQFQIRWPASPRLHTVGE